MSKFAWVTLTTNDTYSLGALVLAYSLKRVSTAHQLAVLITPGVSEPMRNRLKEVYNVVQEVNVLDSHDAANLALLQRPELGVTLTKIHCWRLIQFEKCVFLDSDAIVLQNCDELFEREELSAAPDICWPDCFNSGVFVYRPSLETFKNIAEFAVANGTFDGGDQGLLNQYFSDWAHKDITKHLPFTYNTISFATYSYLPAFKQFRDQIKILHFAGKFKPWLSQFNSESRCAYPPQEFSHAIDYIQLWWNIYCDNVHHNLSDQMQLYNSTDFCAYTTAEMIKDYNNMCFNYNRHFNYNNNYNYNNDNNNYNNNNNNNNNHHYINTNENIEKQFHDPWEDYYENLEKQNQTENHNTFPLNSDDSHSYHCRDYSENYDKSVNQYASNSEEFQNDYNLLNCEHFNSVIDNIVEPSSNNNNNNNNRHHHSSHREESVNQINKMELQHIHCQENGKTDEQERCDPSNKKESSIEWNNYTHQNDNHPEEHDFRVHHHNHQEFRFQETNHKEYDHHHNKDQQFITNYSNHTENNTHFDSNSINHYFNKNSNENSTDCCENNQICYNYHQQYNGNYNKQEENKCEQFIDSSCSVIMIVNQSNNNNNNHHQIHYHNEKHSETNQIIEKYDNVNSESSNHEIGLAGALSKLKLGEARTPEQEEYEQHMRRQCWETGNIDYTGKDSFDNIWRKITHTLETGPSGGQKQQQQQKQPDIIDAEKSDKQLTSADIQDGKVEIDPETGAKSVYKKIKGGYEVTTTIQQPNGTVKTQTKTFYDPTPVSAEDMANKKFITSADIEDGKVEIDPVTKVKTVYKKIKGGYEVITSTPQSDGTIKTRTQTFYDPIPSDQNFDFNDDSSSTTTNKKTTTNKTKTDKTSLAKRTNQLDQHNQQLNQQEQQISEVQTQSRQVKKTKDHRRDSQTTVEEVHMSQKTEMSGRRVITRKGTVEESVDEEEQVKAITEKKDKKKKKQPSSNTTVTEDGKTTVVTKKIPGGTEYHYKTITETGEVVESIKTVYDEEETELTEDEIKQYHKCLKEAEKHKDLTAPKTVKTKQGTTKKVIPEDSGEITTVETVKIDGGTEYHYTTVSAQGIVKKSTKTVYDAVTVEENEQEIIEEYEEEIIEPGEPVVETIQTTKIMQKTNGAKQLLTPTQRKQSELILFSQIVLIMAISWIIYICINFDWSAS